MGIRTSARRRGLNHVPSNDRRQTLAMLLGGGLAGTALGAARQVCAGATRMAPLPEDERFMRMAIAEAARGDFPFGTVIVRDGDVLSTGRNLGRTTNDPTAHGEMVAIRRFVAVRPATGGVLSAEALALFP